jgi:alkanesulfonate monooxygenase SsuD/methylene tetrahydromethanopterin reductase-like flavin-dependent oxidoreductase (luciferase family)
MYDEALVLVRSLTSGNHVDHHGRWFTADDVRFLPARLGHMPIWVAARWPNRRPLERALRHEGLFVIDIDPGDLQDLTALIEQRRTDAGAFELVVQSSDPQCAVEWRAAGATWWLATLNPFDVTVRAVRTMIRRRPEIALA